jgi:hypothetical protein
MAGVEVGPPSSQSLAGDPSLYVGADGLRVGPAHFGGGFSVSADSTRLKADPVATAGVLLKRDVILQCSRTVFPSSASRPAYKCGGAIKF